MRHSSGATPMRFSRSWREELGYATWRLACYRMNALLYPSPMRCLFRSRCHQAFATAALVILGIPTASTHLAAQWLQYPTAGAPRKADGKLNMSAPAPRMADGKP